MSTIPEFEDGTLSPIVEGDDDTTNQFQSNYTFDVVATVDPDTGEQLFAAAEIMKANVLPASKTMDHPLEDGSPVSDYRIILPVVIDLGILVSAQDFDSTYAQITLAFLAGSYLTVRTNADTFENLIIESMPSDETPEMFGMLQISLRLREIQLVEVTYQQLKPKDVAKTTDQSTVQAGEKQTQTGNSVLYDASNYFGFHI